MIEQDDSLNLQEQFRAAKARRQALRIMGSGSKAFYGRETTGEPLLTTRHVGLLAYEPSELVLTARTGTPVAQIQAVLAGHGQMLGFDPPLFGANATVGGMVACGLSGPGRPFAGAVRDHLLGVKLLNGNGEILRFGGQVIKNVAGFDLSRLMAGALGTLGLLLEVSLRVLPKPGQTLTLAFDLPTGAALAAMTRWQGQCLPITAACHVDGRAYLRLGGSEPVLKACAAQLGGEPLSSGEALWDGLREQTADFFQHTRPLWRLSLPPATPPLPLPGDWWMDWGGALRWLKTDAPAESVFAEAARCGGHACLFRGGERGGVVFQPLPPPLRALHQRLKQAFDPHALFNPGRLYPEW